MKGKQQQEEGTINGQHLFPLLILASLYMLKYLDLYTQLHRTCSCHLIHTSMHFEHKSLYLYVIFARTCAPMLEHGLFTHAQIHIHEHGTHISSHRKYPNQHNQAERFKTNPNQESLLFKPTTPNPESKTPSNTYIQPRNTHLEINQHTQILISSKPQQANQNAIKLKVGSFQPKAKQRGKNKKEIEIEIERDQVDRQYFIGLNQSNFNLLQPIPYNPNLSHASPHLNIKVNPAQKSISSLKPSDNNTTQT